MTAKFKLCPRINQEAPKVNLLNPSKVKPDKEIPVPYFLVYPYHRMKVVDQYVFDIVSNGRVQRCGSTKEDAIRLKKDWGYMIKKDRNKDLEKLQEANKVSIKNWFNIHEHCNAE